LLSLLYTRDPVFCLQHFNHELPRIGNRLAGQGPCQFQQTAIQINGWKGCQAQFSKAGHVGDQFRTDDPRRLCCNEWL